MDEKDRMIYALEEEVKRLNSENKKLDETVSWMHDLIWKLVKEREETRDPADDDQAAVTYLATNSI